MAKQKKIDKQIFKLWQKYRRKGDSAEICADYDCSRPTIDTALNEGYCNASLQEFITKFFSERLIAEYNADAEQLKALTVPNPYADDNHATPDNLKL